MEHAQGKENHHRILYHMPFCPFSRKIVFGLKEKNLDFHEVKEKTWKLSPELLEIKGEVPSLVDGDMVCRMHDVACEYLDDAYTPSLMGATLYERLTVRNITRWCDNFLYQNGYLHLFYEKALKRYSKSLSPDMAVIKQGRLLLKKDLEYLDGLAEQSTYLAGRFFSWADISAASHLSCLDYLGDVSWFEFPSLKEWYSKIKSRPTFRSFLTQVFPGLTPVEHYPMLDF